MKLDFKETKINQKNIVLFTLQLSNGKMLKSVK